MKKVNKVDSAPILEQWSFIWQSLVKIHPGFKKSGNLLGIIHEYVDDSDDFAFPQTPPDEKLGSTFDFFRRDPVAAAYYKDQDVVAEFKTRVKAGEDISDFHDRGYDISMLALAWFFDEKDPLPIHQLPTLLNFRYAVVRKKSFYKDFASAESLLSVKPKPLISFLVDDKGGWTDEGKELVKGLKCDFRKAPLDASTLERFKNEVLRLPKFEQALFSFPYAWDKLAYDLELMGLSWDRDHYITYPSAGVIIAYQRAAYGDDAVISTPVLGPLCIDDIDESGHAGQRYKNVFTGNSLPPSEIHGKRDLGFLAAQFHDDLHGVAMSAFTVSHRAFVWLMLDKKRELTKRRWSVVGWYLADFVFPVLQQKYKKIDQLKIIFNDGTEMPELPNLSMLAYTLIKPEELKAIGLDYQEITATVFEELSDPDYFDYIKKLATNPALNFIKIEDNKLALSVKGQNKDEKDVVMKLDKEWSDFTAQAQLSQAKMLHPTDAVVAIRKWGLIQQCKMKLQEPSPALQNTKGA